MCMLLYAWEETSSTVCQYRCVSAFWENEGTLWAVWRGSWEVGEGLVLRTLWHMFSLSPLPTSLNFFHWTINALLPWGVVTEGGMRGYHLLFINTGSGNTPHCQPNPLSLHLVPWQGGWGGVGWGRAAGAAVTRYRGPDVRRMRMTGSSPRCSSGCMLMKTGWGGV